MSRWLWVAAAGAVGLAASGVFAGLLGLGRSVFVAAFGVLALPFLAAYAHQAGVHPLAQLRRRWRAGLIGGLLLGLVLVWTVASQPASPAPVGAALVADLLWLGAVYGTIDALLLSVLPVVALYGAQPAHHQAHAAGRARWAAAALLASLVVTALYHAGFAEFRGAALLQPLVGNGLLTLGYLLTGNPLTPVIGHVAMHVAAVLHGAATTVQLPPHY